MNLNQRLAKVHCIADAENQLNLAEAYVKRCRNIAKKAKSLAEKIELMKKIKDAESTMWEFRRKMFDIHDAILSGRPATSVLTDQ